MSLIQAGELMGPAVKCDCQQARFFGIFGGEPSESRTHFMQLQPCLRAGVGSQSITKEKGGILQVRLVMVLWSI